MINTQYIHLNMVPSGVLPVLHCSQYDVGRPLGVVVHNGSESVDLSQYTATIEATRTDGAAITTTVTSSGTFATTATMTNKADRYFAQLVLVQNGQRVASLPFVMCVVPAAMDENSEAVQEDASLFAQFSTSMQSSLAALTAESAANSARIDNMIALQTEGSMQGSKITTFVAQSAAQYTSSADWQSFSFCDYSLHYNTTPSMSVLDGLSNPVLLSAGAYILASQSASITDEPVYVNLTDDVRFYNHGYLGAAPDKRAVEINMPKVTDAAGNISGMWLLFVFCVVSDVPVDLSEITDARVGANGVTYQTLGSAIRSQVSNLETAINDTTGNTMCDFLDGYWVGTSSPVDITPVATASVRSCCVVSASAGDIFELTGTGFSSTHRLWCFINSSGTILSYSASNAVADGVLLTAPENAAYLVVNASTEASRSLYKNQLLIERINDETSLLHYAQLMEDDDLDDISESGWYSWTSSHVPSNAPKQGLAGKVLCLVAANGSQFQLYSLAASDAGVFYRNRTTSSWGNWVKLEQRDYVVPTYADLTNLMTNNVLAEGSYSLTGYVDTNELNHILVSITAKYTGTNAPYISVESHKSNGTRLYYSPNYEIASTDEFINQAWRIPNNEYVSYFIIKITVPAGATLDVRQFMCKVEHNRVYSDERSIIVHAHRGFEHMYPSDTYNSMVAAAQLGFNSCIVIPKFTSDGVPVCFHNDGGPSSKLSSIITNVDGTPVSSLSDTSKISDFTYAQLAQWSVGYTKNESYAYDRILKMDDFLQICARYGMRPIFSIHPAPTVAQWGILKDLLDKYKLTDKLSVKSGDTSVWKNVIDVFGDGNIYSIINIVGETSVYDVVSKIATGRSTSGATNTRIDVEFYDSALKTEEYGPYQTAQLTAAINAGYTASIILDNYTTGDEMKAYIESGVTEFTNNRHFSIGLNW